jgi:hypothetical protein
MTTKQTAAAARSSAHRIVSERSVLRHCNQISATDDRLGAFSDYEGNKDGPTWHLWTTGKERFAAYCARAIELHERALKHWKAIRRLNESR